MVVHHNNKSLRDLYTTEAKDWRALAIRGAACLYRLRGILQEQQQHEGDVTNNDLLLTKESNRVCREAFHICAPLASRMGMHRLKNELEHAAFQILYRRQHRTYESLLKQSSSPEPNIEESMEEILAHVKDTMTEFLNNDAVFMASVTNFEVTARVKESYSTWKKMIRNGFDHITQVPDAMALRIVLDAKKEHPDESDDVTRARERALCYYVQQLCQTVWAPHHEDPRFKDYIAHPKENGYQSLHYTAGTKWRNNEEWKMEMQVRTGAMHKLAEFGVASHWNYK
ncbi:Nucleotidyltransferase, partial [Fragilariopsis cylindrus CCMP1102]